MSFDGSGDNESLMMARCEGNDIKILDRVYFPNSLGHFLYVSMPVYRI
jgi:predicted NodU family carbamoyl transferase